MLRTNGACHLLPAGDNWIYIQEPDVTVGRLQIFNNWSPYMVADPSKTWWAWNTSATRATGCGAKATRRCWPSRADEIGRLGLVEAARGAGRHRAPVPKAYPAYFGSYGRFGELREYWIASRTCCWSAATACTATTTRTTRCWRR